MLLLLTIFTLMLISTVAVIAATMLSSNLSEQESWIQTIKINDSVSAEGTPYSI